MKANIQRTATFSQESDQETGELVDVLTFETIITFEIPQPQSNATLKPEFIGTSNTSQEEADEIAFGLYGSVINPQVAFLNANSPT